MRLASARKPVQSASLTSLVGAFEMLLGIAVLLKPARGLLLGVFAWKVGTERLRLLAGEPIWAVVERGGRYGASLALFLLTQLIVQNKPTALEPTPIPGRAQPPIRVAAAT